ncbi:AraC family transcriptional regulator [Shewanella atlantica]|uniref:AraC family transcriptional regulator n=1 Tax=Shewanella atlantica TaxID=271099 RepID=A0A3S0IEQ1_9GAMM|nr:AraC family transcriptional regulator [Shewanella atlantica]RTR32142.1 AraC family transcriptional regulator [Shewanella atlantica]
MTDFAPLYAQLTHRYQLAGKQEIVNTEIPGVRYFHSPHYSARTAVVYEPGIVIIGTGKKAAYLAGQEFHYHAGQHLLLTVPLPLECETLASLDEPLQGFFIELNLPKLHQMVHEILSCNPNAFDEKNDKLTGIEQVPVSAELAQIQQRLLQTLQFPLDARMLGPGIVNELIYRILRSPQGQPLYALVCLTSLYGNIAKTINQVQEDLAKNYTVDELAVSSGMSISAFHRAFKQVTQESPLQYIKKMKLFKAKTMIVHEELSVSLAARRVGYESVSQFSREFKRLFKVPPSQSKTICYAQLV